MRLYITPNTRQERDVLDVMRLYGLQAVILTDAQGTYVDLTPPDYWSKSRKRRFKEAIKRATSQAS